MNLIRTVVEALLNGFLSLVDLLEPLVGGIFGRLLDTEVAPGGARTLTVLILLVVGSLLISNFYFSVTKSSANGPMEIKLTTSQTPAQVVAKDREKHLKAILVAGAILAVIYLLVR